MDNISLSMYSFMSSRIFTAMGLLKSVFIAPTNRRHFSFNLRNNMKKYLCGLYIKRPFKGDEKKSLARQAIIVVRPRDFKTLFIFSVAVLRHFTLCKSLNPFSTNLRSFPHALRRRLSNRLWRQRLTSSCCIEFHNFLAIMSLASPRHQLKFLYYRDQLNHRRMRLGVWWFN